MAPELLDSDASSILSKGSDIYSFAMVVIEVSRARSQYRRNNNNIFGKIFTGRAPFHGYSEEAVIIRVIEGKRPDRPTAEDLGLTDAIWDLVEMCWQVKLEKRPTVSYALRYLRKAANLKLDVQPLMTGFNLLSRGNSDASVPFFSSTCIPSKYRFLSLKLATEKDHARTRRRKV